MTGDASSPSPFVEAIHIAKAARLDMVSIDSATLTAGKGIAGDRYEEARHRHITIQSQDGLDEASAELGAPIVPGSTRRNITISNGEIPSKPGDRIRIGTVEAEVVRIAAPCKMLDDVIGVGARTALRYRAGSVFRVLAGGTIKVGDRIELSPESDEE